MIRPPARNLSPMAEPWGRWAEAEVIRASEQVEILGGDMSNDGRANNSRMDLMAGQINEMYMRQSGLVTADNVSTGSFSSGIVTRTATLTIPAPEDAPRYGWVGCQVAMSLNNALDTFAYVSMSVNGQLFHRDSRAVPEQMVAPASWGNESALAGYSAFVGSPGAPTVVSLTLQGEVGFSTGARILNFTDIRATYQYGQRV